MNNQDYKELCIYTIGLIKNKPHLLAEDVVNDVVLYALESGESLQVSGLRRKIYSYIKTQIYTIRTVHTLVKYNDETSKYCKDCNEDKPIAAFSIITRSSGVKEIFYICKECQAIKVATHRNSFAFQQKKNNPDYKERRVEEQMKYYHKVKHTEHYKEKNRERQKRFQEKKRMLKQQLILKHVA